MFFLIGNMKFDDILILFDYLKFTSEEVEARWHHAYEHLLDNYLSADPSWQ